MATHLFIAVEESPEVAHFLGFHPYATRTTFSLTCVYSYAAAFVAIAGCIAGRWKISNTLRKANGHLNLRLMLLSCVLPVYAALVFALNELPRSCLFKPCAPQSIGEWDQAFPLVCGLVMFTFQVGEDVVKLGSRVRELFVNAQPSGPLVEWYQPFKVIDNQQSCESEGVRRTESVEQTHAGVEIPRGVQSSEVLP